MLLYPFTESKGFTGSFIAKLGAGTCCVNVPVCVNQGLSY